MKIEVGKSYRTRHGEKVTITSISGDTDCPMRADDGKTFTSEGSFDSNYAGETIFDLIAEWQDDLPVTMHTAPVTAPDILDRAGHHMRDRAATYDSPGGERSMARTVAVFNALHGLVLSEEQGWSFMACLKQVRLTQQRGYHADSAEDLAAYVALMAEARARA